MQHPGAASLERLLCFCGGYSIPRALYGEPFKVRIESAFFLSKQIHGLIVLMLPVLGALAAWETLWWARRVAKRTEVYNLALARARAEGLPLINVGAPDGGATPGPGCGDISIDICESSCPVHLKADITKPLPFASNSAVVFVSCVLEYVDDVDAAIRELLRVSGGRLYVVRVEPWTLAAYFYPGAKRTLPAKLAR